MMTEDYVSFETAKFLKEKGFGEEVLTYYVYDTESKSYEFRFDDRWDNPNNFPGDCISAPTLQMAMKWLREVHNQIIVPGISLDDRTSSTINHYIVGIWYIPKNNGGAFCYTSPTPYNGYPSFEEACEAAIKYCLENLI